jgi:hypothetical protein
MNSLTLVTTAKQWKTTFSFNRKLYYIIGLLLLGSLQTATAQTAGRVHGVVLNDQGNPLANVSVVRKTMREPLRPVQKLRVMFNK